MRRVLGPWQFLRKQSSYLEAHTRVRGRPIQLSIAEKVPRIRALQHRLQLNDIPADALARSLIDGTSTLDYVNNTGLSRFGRTLLSFYALRHFMIRYPRLPSHVLKHLVHQYTSMPALAEHAKLWGIQPDNRSSLGRYLSGEEDTDGLGFLSYSDKIQEVEPGIQKIQSGSAVTSLTDAMGGCVRAIVASVYAHRGLELVEQFVSQYIIEPRQVDLTQIMAFSKPTRELSVLCAREGMEPPVSRLLAESGRFSSQAVFVAGVFSGDMKLGEGQGTSLNEARTRAAVNALQGWYLFSPKVSNYVDAGEVVI